MERRRTVITRPASHRQAGVMVCDGSLSMTDMLAGPATRELLATVGKTKGQAVGEAIAGLVARFARTNAPGKFSFAGVNFTNRVESTWGPVPAADLDLSRSYDPTVGATGEGTSIAAGLERAEQMLSGFLAQANDGLPSSAVVLVCSDGMCQTPDATRAIAARLKADPRVTVACAFFETAGAPPDGLSILREVCSEPADRYCTLVHDAETLRGFWEATMVAAANLPAPSVPLG